MLRHLVLCTVLLTSPAGAAGLCRWTTPDGHRGFGDRAPPGVAAVCEAPRAPKPAAALPEAPAPSTPDYSTAEMDYNRHLAERLIGSDDPQKQALGRELGRQLDAYQRAVEQRDQAIAHREAVERQAVINQRAIEREFSDLTR